MKLNSKKLAWFLGYEVVKFMFLASFLGWALSFANAHEPVFPEPIGPDDYIHLDELNISTAYYGTLLEFPHTYRIEAAEPTRLHVELLAPAFIEGNYPSAILVREEKRGVSEVARINATDAAWEPFYEVWGGDSYRRGPTFTTELAPGSYIFEVSTPDNLSKYVLVVGEEERLTLKGYFEMLGKIYEVKRFMEKSPLAVFQSPLYYLPGLLILAFAFWLWRRRHKAYD